jgi:hypothetical protein
MKTIFDNATREELLKRIDTLNEYSKPQWGKMNIYQMLKHCRLCEEMYLGKITYKRQLIGRLFGRIGLKKMLNGEKPFPSNAPTSPAFKVKETTGDLQAEKTKWMALIREYEQYSNDNFVHWFFGKMTKEQVGYFVYKHTDHHLRQFNS